MEKMKSSSLHDLIWSQTISCPKITKKRTRVSAEFVVVERISKEGHQSSNKGREDLYLFLFIGAYLKHHRNERTSITTVFFLGSLIVYKRRNISTSIRGERNLIDLSFLFGHALASSLKYKKLLCTSPYSYTKLSINCSIWFQDFDVSLHTF